jgi:hypothetical protein
MADLSRADRETACQELDHIEQILSAMSQWVDGPSADREKASIMLEDAARAVAAAAWTIQRDPVRVAGLVHRRQVLTTMPPTAG